jgi:tetratricopeptide (TPR) repeat protein
MRPRLPAYVLVLGLASACASGPPPAVTPQDVPALESQSQRNPTDPELMTRLGVAYYEARSYDRARDVLQSSLALDKSNYSTLVYLGLTYEELGQLDSARASYNKASAFTKSQDQRNQISNHLALLTRKELHQAARTALAQEAALSQQAPTENAIAVLPVRYLGSDSALQPLERGVTHLMISDFSKVGRLRLLEREQVQALVDEMKLSDEGRTDPATGARSGRLLRAERVVQGSLQDIPSNGQLKLDADVVNTETAGVQASGTASDKLQQLFDIEKQVVMQLLQRLDITLSPAEQRALSERPTADLQAFLAFSRGLDAEDRGDYKAAEAAYNQAVSRDPNFRAAKERRDEMIQVSSAAGLPPQQFAGLELPGGGTVPGLGSEATTLETALTVTVPSTGGGLINRIGPISTPPPANRPSLPEASGTDVPGGGLFGIITIIVTRP